MGIIIKDKKWEVMAAACDQRNNVYQLALAESIPYGKLWKFARI